MNWKKNGIIPNKSSKVKVNMKRNIQDKSFKQLISITRADLSNFQYYPHVDLQYLITGQKTIVMPIKALKCD